MNLNLIDDNGNINQEMLREHIGQRKIIPSSFPDSYRFRQKKYEQAMAIVSRYGKPDFFLTFTTNPMWREIQENLLPGETAADRHELVNRVFECKLRRLIDDIYKNGILGYCIAYVGVVEFQKRGLPHCHLLITMATGSKPISGRCRSGD